MVERIFPSLNKYIINDSKILPLLDIDANATQIRTSSTSGP